MKNRFDIVVIGSGIAGLTTALAAAPKRGALITRGALAHDGSSRWAQFHAQDTLVAGQYLKDSSAVDRLTSTAPHTVRWLAAHGARFDTQENARHEKRFVPGCEAAHSRARIVHAGSDARRGNHAYARTSGRRSSAHHRVRAFASDRFADGP